MVFARAQGAQKQVFRPVRSRLHYLALVVVLLLLAVTVMAVLREGARLSALLSGEGLSGIEHRYQYFSAPQWRDPQAALAGPFEPAPFTRSSAPFAHRVQWHLLELHNTTAKPRSLALLIDNPLVDLAEVYVVTDTDELVLLGRLGEQAAGLDRQQRAVPHLHFSLGAAAHERLLVGHFTEGSPLFPLSVLPADALTDYLIFANQIWAGFLGVALLICLYNFMLYLAIGDRTYIFYIGYVLSVLVAFGASSGYGHLLLPDTLSIAASEHIVFLNALSMIFAVQFALYFLKLDQDARPRFYVAQVFCAVVAVMALCSLFVPEYLTGPVFSAVHGLSYLLAAFLFSFRFRERLPWTRFYLISWAPFLLGVGLLSAMFQGVVPYGLLARFAGIAGVALEMALMSMALADRLIKYEQIRLYQATHDPVLGLGLYDVLDSALAVPPVGHRCVVNMEVANYHDMVPYLSEAQFRAVMTGLARMLVERLSRQANVLVVDPDNPIQSQAVLSKSELISVAIEVRSRDEVEQLLAGLAVRDDFNPCPEEVPYLVQCRFGAAFVEPPVPTPLAAFNHGLVALDMARQNTLPYWVFSQDDLANADRRIRLARDLDRAISDGSLLLYFQPKLDLEQPSCQLAEVLLRWQHPELGWVAPDEIIEIAESTGLIGPLTRWVLHCSLQFMHDQASLLPSRVQLSVNVSAHDLSDEDFAAYLLQLLQNYPVVPQQLTLEVTESARLTDSAAFAANLSALRERGVRFAVDDFGTGYAALSYATAYPFDELKIDRSFTSQLMVESRYYTAIRATVAMASRLGMQVTAEGVEAPEDGRVLSELGCRFLQGYWVARPLTEADYLRWVSEGRSAALVSTMQGDGPLRSGSSETL